MTVSFPLKPQRKILPPEQARAYAEHIQGLDWNDPSTYKAIAETIVFELKEELVQDDLMRILGVDVRTFLPGQTPEWRTTKGLKVFTSQPGAAAPRSQVSNQSIQLTTEEHHIHPEINLVTLRSGRYGDIQDLKNEALEKLQGFRYNKIWGTVVGSVASTDANYWTVANSASSAAKKNALDSGINYAEDVAGSKATVIVGRRNELTWLADYAAYPSNAPSEAYLQLMERNIFPPVYRSLPVIYLNQFEDGWGLNMITEDEIFVMGLDTVKMGIDMELTALEDIDTDTATWHMNMWERYGTAVFNPLRNARIKLT